MSAEPGSEWIRYAADQEFVQWARRSPSLRESLRYDRSTHRWRTKAHPTASKEELQLAQSAWERMWEENAAEWTQRLRDERREAWRRGVKAALDRKDAARRARAKKQKGKTK